MRFSVAAHPVSSLSIVAASALATCVAACGSIVVAPASGSPCPSPPASPATSARAPLTAGVAVADITPSPGLSLLGHGPEGRVSRGTMLRLRCQVFVFTQKVEDHGVPREEAVAFVPCDLSWPSLLLTRRVAADLLTHAPVVPLGADRIVLSATHTHASPAHYVPAANYSGPLSTEAPGYSDEVVDYLSRAIANGVREAWGKRAPACVAWSKASFHDAPGSADPSRDRGEWVLDGGLGKNRSLDAFSRDALDDEERARFLDPSSSRSQPFDAPPPRPALFALEGTVSVLRIDRCPPSGGHEPLGALVVTGVHPTAVPNLNDLYHGDLFGYATREAAARIRDAGSIPPVVGIANGLEGDVSPLVDYQGPREARRLGGLLARQIASLWTDAGTRLLRASRLRAAYRELELGGARVATKNDFYDDLRALYRFPGLDSTSATIADPLPGSRAARSDPALCAFARLGTAAAGGAKDGRTFFLELPEMREGAISPASRSCHAPKYELDPPAALWAAFPRRAPIYEVVVGDELVTTFPGEVTTVAGHRARRQLEAWLGARRGEGADEARSVAAKEVVQIGLTGEYLQYVATSDEYQSQQYEGASTLYGPNEARFFANQQVCLARWLYEPGMTPASDRECALDYGDLETGERRPQPLPGEVRAVPFETGGSRSGDAFVECGAEPRAACDVGFRCFASCEELDLDTRAPKTVVAGCGPHVYQLQRDGERGFGTLWIPPDGCDEAAKQPRVRVVADDGGEELASDEGDGIEVRFAGGRWHVGWYPSQREAERARRRPFHFEIRARRGAPAENGASARACCWDP